MILTVTGLRELADMDCGSFDYAVSLFDDKETCELFTGHMWKTGPQLIGKHAAFIFDDITDRYHKEAPTLEAVFQLEQIFKNCDHSTNMLIHCHGGVSRSTAVAIMYILMIKKCTFEQAYSRLYDIRRQMWPNELIIEYIDHVLNFEGKLVAFDKKWKEDNLGGYWPRPPIRVKNT